MKYRGAIRIIAMGMILAALAACGASGGSGGGDGSGGLSGGITGMSLEQLRAEYDQKRSDAYQGETQQAELDETNLIAYAHLYFGEWPGAAVTGSASTAGAGKTAMVTSFASKARTQLAGKTGAIVSVATQKTTVNESEPCDNINGVVIFPR